MPDPTIAQNLRLTQTPLASVRRRLEELDVQVDFSALALEVPLPLQRMLDLARALAHEPKLLILDEITAALPSDLAERVFSVMRELREQGRSVLFITHRLNEVIAECDSATASETGRRWRRLRRARAASSGSSPPCSGKRLRRRRSPR